MKFFVRFVLIALAATFATASLIPLIPTEWWWVRLLDFPRLPFAAALIAVGVGLLMCLQGAPRSSGSALALVVVGLAVNGWILRPYLPTQGLAPDSCPTERRLSVLIANIQFGNREAGPLLAAVRRTEPDLFLAMETDAWWEDALKPVADAMPYTLKRITGSYYGIHFFSRLTLVNGEIRHLAGQDTPAVITGLTLRTGEVVDFVGIHPKPPQPWQSARGRDAQLYAAAAVLRERVEPGLLAGDLNATPWEIAVARMRRLSGLIDPRRGFGYLATWNATSWWMRWPLDHIFHEGGFVTLSVERLDAFGSDHFPYLVRLCRQTGQGKNEPAPEEADIGTANAVLSAAGASERLQAR